MTTINTVFCIDTSAFVDINRLLIKLVPNLFSELDKLFSSGRIVSHEIVYDEITTHSKKPDSLTKWILPKKVFFKDISIEQTIYVSDIIQKYPTLISYKSEKNDADPWIIATALELRNVKDMFSVITDYAVVSTESEKIPNHIPDVCKHYKIKHYSLSQFFKSIGWELQLKTP